MVDSPFKKLSRDQKLAKQHELFAVVEREQDKARAKIRENTARLKLLRLARDAEQEKRESEERLTKKTRKRTPATS